MIKRRLVLMVLALAALATPLTMLGTQSAASGCEKDTDCKGDRVCEDGSCRAPRGKRKEREDGEGKEESKGLPHYCCTAAGKLGPYANPQNGVAVKEGEACYGTTPSGQRVNGVACY